MKRLLLTSLSVAFFSGICLAENFVVVIDPGHGGEWTEGRNDGSQESHGVSYNNASVTLPSGREVLEKNLALDYSQALAESLNQETGVKALLTRDDDSSISAMTRAAVAVENQADVYLSIHFNSGGASGPRAYIVSEDHSEWEYFHFTNPYIKRDAALAERLVVGLEEGFAPFGGTSSPVKVFNDSRSPTNSHGYGNGNLKDGIRNIGYARMDTHLFNAAVVLLEIEFMDTESVAEWLLGDREDEVLEAGVSSMVEALLDYRDNIAPNFRVDKPEKAPGR